MIYRSRAAGLIALAIAVGIAAPALCAAGAASVSQAPVVLAQAEGATSAGGATAAKEACAAPHQYVDLINAGKYDQIGGLFADDAVYMGPDGKTRHGSEAIGKFYTGVMNAMRPRVKAVSFIQQGDDCVMELANQDKRSGKYSLVAIDHFTVDSQGKISRFIVFLRPGTGFQHTLNAAIKKAQ